MIAEIVARHVKLAVSELKEMPLFRPNRFTRENRDEYENEPITEDPPTPENK